MITQMSSCRVALPLLVFLLYGCTGAAELNRGPSPVLKADHVESASRDMHRILGALRSDAANGLGDASWYEVTLAGFNYVDDQCVAYFDRLFFLDRQRAAAKSGLDGFGQTTNAILAITEASKLSMTVVAQAFGLASHMTDVVANSYLYTLPPASTLAFVRKTQRAYRDGVALKQQSIQTPTSAYHEIQQYLELCLPPTIEAGLVSHINNAEAIPAPGSAEVRVIVGSDMNVQERVKNTPVIRAEDRVTTKPPRQKLSTQQAEAADIFTDNSYYDKDVKILQRKFCVPPGPVGPSTKTRIKAAIRLFEDWQQNEKGVHADGKINPIEFIIAIKGRDCDIGGKFKNIFEAEKLSTVEAVEDFIIQLNKNIPEQSIDTNVPLSSEADSVLRRKITQANIHYKINDYDGQMKDQVTHHLFKKLNIH